MFSSHTLLNIWIPALRNWNGESDASLRTHGRDNQLVCLQAVQRDDKCEQRWDLHRVGPKQVQQPPIQTWLLEMLHILQYIISALESQHCVVNLNTRHVLIGIENLLVYLKLEILCLRIRVTHSKETMTVVLCMTGCVNSCHFFF